jgi:glycosyltransferase involved in cell wall biosynthesis
LLKPSLTNVIYCPNGVDVELFTPTNSKKYDSRNIRIGWIGKNRPAKNLSVVTEVSKKLNESGVVISPIVVEKKFRMTGMSLAKIKSYYSGIDFYLCASWNEGTPNPALEAGACGIPLISTKVGNMPDVIVDGVNGYFVNPSVESIIKQLEDLKGISVEDYRSMSDSIRDTIEVDWSWQKNIRYYSEAFDFLTE